MRRTIHHRSGSTPAWSLQDSLGSVSDAGESVVIDSGAGVCDALAAYQQRLSSNLSLPAKDRYGYFVELYPSLSQNLPQKYIASYIGVTPEFLSKMLNQPASGR